ncbi:DUF433 domain-containing protein (plasmid) [Polymorphobacter megasporae]|nr:DUF433 domain-containing protein [Polymorphobacter megasporae]UAJ12615.1 DUF433 domain-containing protein [Polymorphobacter megasporae]
MGRHFEVPSVTENLNLLKPTEAAVVSGVELKIVNHAIDRALPLRVVRRGKERSVSAEACFYIAFYHSSAGKLTADERRFAILDIDKRVEAAGEGTSRWLSLRRHCTVRHDFLALDLDGFWNETHERWGRYMAAREMVKTDPDILGGTPVITGTRVPVHDVAASVAAGLSPSRIASAYPSLDAEQIELAALYARANPLQGRRPVRRPLEGATILSKRTIERRRRSA